MLASSPLRAGSEQGRASMRRRGFTVLEVVVALAIGGMVLLGARLTIAAVADGADAIRALATDMDAEANGDRLLRSLLRQIETATGGDEFGGDRQQTRFTSWCTVEGGWRERCRVTLAVGELAGQMALVVALSAADTLIVRRGFSAGELRYIGDAARGGTWFELWGDGIATPLALAMILDTDTVIVRIGVRG